MPMIEFVGDSGKVIEEFHHTPVDKVVRNGKTYVRAEIPTRAFGVHGFAREREQKDEVREGLRRDELSGKKWRCIYSPKQIKKVWNI